jgi:rRNA maturation endonuclease Nob1
MKPIPTPIRARLEKIVRCPYCGAEVYHEMKFCPKCGKNLINPEVKTRQQKERDH